MPVRRGLTRRHWLAAAALAGALDAPKAQTALTLDIAGSRILVLMDEDFAPAMAATVRPWVQAAAEAVVGYLGRFPLTQLELQLQAVGDDGVQGGRTAADPDPFVRVRLGRLTPPAALVDDWVLVHEFVHLAVPRVPRSQNWLHEGLATYVEGVARVRAGRNTAGRLWAELVRSLPQGQPRAGDRGLDHTPSWGRTYWGGALFCLQADVALLRASGRRAGLREALQGVLAAGGSYAVAWPVPRILAVAEQAAGAPVLLPLYAAMKDSSTPVDLAALWQWLGVRLDGASPVAAFDDAAEGAAVRRAIA